MGSWCGWEFFISTSCEVAADTCWWYALIDTIIVILPRFIVTFGILTLYWRSYCEAIWFILKTAVEWLDNDRLAHMNRNSWPSQRILVIKYSPSMKRCSATYTVRDAADAPNFALAHKASHVLYSMRRLVRIGLSLSEVKWCVDDNPVSGIWLMNTELLSITSSTRVSVWANSGYDGGSSNLATFWTYS